MNPTRQIITGVGKPRLIREMASAVFTSSTGTTYTSTTVVDTTALSSVIVPGMRIRAKKVTPVSALEYEVLSYAKVLSVDLTAKTITVDEWVNGTPTNAKAFTIDGWIADLPRVLEGGLKETFDPIVLRHNLWRNRKKTKLFGYDYSAELGWEKKFSPDAFFEMRNVMQQQITGSDETIILIPRVDKPNIAYSVFVEDPFTIANAPDQKVHTGFALTFIGKDPIATPPHFLWSGYGTGSGRTTAFNSKE
jgi:hypothetical protein